MPARLLGRVVLVAAVAFAVVCGPSTLAQTPPVESAAEVVPPQIILKTQRVPDFPPAAKAGRFKGAVMLEMTVFKDGKVGKVKVLDCTRPKVGFEEAAIDAVKQWRFEPGKMAGEPVDYELKFRLNFGEGAQGDYWVSAGSFTSGGTSATGGTASSSAGGSTSGKR